MILSVRMAAKPDCCQLLELMSLRRELTAHERVKQAVCIGHTVSDTISALLLAQVAAVTT